MEDRRLLWSSASEARPAGQATVEQSLFAAAHRGEIRLHVSSLAGRVLSIGEHAPVPPAVPGAALLHRRRSGGRPVASGAAFRIVTLALPARTSLLGAQAAPIAPEQVLNRGVRGLLAGLRHLGVDPAYPGLDLVTAGGRSLAHLGFAESDRGAVLLQAVLACRETLAESTRLLDELDPAGVLATTPISPGSATCLAQFASGIAPDARPGMRLGDPSVEMLGDLLARTWAGLAGLEAVPAEPPATRPGDGEPDRGEEPFPPPPAGATTVLAPSRLGIALAWVATRDGRIVEAAVGGDVIAPDGARARIARAVEGCPSDRHAIAVALRGVLDRERTWLLGITPDELADLLARAAGATP